MILRRAEPSDLARLRRWDTKPHMAAAPGDDGAFDWEAELGRNPDWRELLTAEVAGRPVGVMQIVDPAREEARYWGEVEAELRAIDIWTDEEANLGRGRGTRMMELAIALLRRSLSQSHPDRSPRGQWGRLPLLRAPGLPPGRAAPVRCRRLLRLSARPARAVTDSVTRPLGLGKRTVWPAILCSVPLTPPIS